MLSLAAVQSRDAELELEEPANLRAQSGCDNQVRVVFFCCRLLCDLFYRSGW